MKNLESRAPLGVALALATTMAALPAVAASPSTPGLAPRGPAAASQRAEPARPAPGRLGFAEWLLDVLRGRLDTTPFGSEAGSGADTDPATDPDGEPAPPTTDAVCPPERVHCPLG